MNEALAPYCDLLPSGDTNSHCVELDDGGVIVAGRHALILIRDGEVVDSGMWYEVQNARWKGELQELSVNWVDPARPALVVHASGSSVRAFMDDLTEKVHRTQVMVRTVSADNGTVITAQIRRREDRALFSVVSANGALDDQGLALARSFEAQLRESVGLD